jgi:RDD family protein
VTADPVLALTILLSAVFALIYLPLVARCSRGLVSPYAKADIRKRCGAAMVDGLLVASCLIAYRSLTSVLFLVVAAIYLLFRDALFVPGQSVGKFCFSLLVISLESGRPCGRMHSVTRNVMFLIPGLNLVAAVLEITTVIRDPQGQRLGDRVAHTQVVEGLGAKELVTMLQKGLLEEIQLQRDPIEPVEVERRRRSA